MRKLGIIAVLSLIVTALAAVPALAVAPTSVEETGGLHVCQGTTLDVEAVKTFDDFGNLQSVLLEGTGEVCGAGTGGTATLTADVEVVTGCINPGSKQHQPRGLQRTTTTTTGTAELEITRPGRGVFDVETTPVGTAGRTCPGQDIPVLVSATFTNITLVIESQTGTVTATFPDIVDP
jgi:hypothetical protein